MKELNTIQSLIITILIIIATSLISINSREVDSTIITIEKGMSLNSVSKLLLDENIIVDEEDLEWMEETRAWESYCSSCLAIVDFSSIG